MSLAQLAKARNSKFKPFPPQNAYFKPGAEEVREAIAQVADRMLHPPISNIGVKGIRKSGTEMLKKSGDLWTDLAMGLKNALEVEKPGELIVDLPDRFKGIADLETETFEFLSEVVG
jgi:hypothetical protein